MEQVVSFLFKYRAGLFSKSQFGFGARPSVVLIVALAGAAAFLVYYIYARPSTSLTPGWRARLIALRLALVAAVLFCLMRPVIVAPSVVPQSSYVAVLMDDSASMQLAEDGGTRLDQVKRVMTAGAGFHTALSEKFKVRAFKFSDSTERVGDASELEGAGGETRLEAALEQAARDSAGLPLSGIIVMTDGAASTDPEVATDMAATLENLRARGVPVLTVGVGRTRLEGDVEMVRATAPRRVLVGSPVTAELLLRASGGRTVKINITEDSHPLLSRDVAVQTESTDSTATVAVARVTFTPSSRGLHRYSFTAAPSSDELNTENNSQELLIEVEDAHPKILYIEGEPRWEYGKLRTALAEEKNVAIVSVMRSADGKFYRQGIENADELATGFPKSEEELFRYDAVMIGSIEATFFTFDQLRAIEQFVSRRGGTLLALGGAKSFNAGAYANTPIADLLPVYLSGQAAQSAESQTFKAAPSDRGRDHPAARLADEADANQKVWEGLPAITLPEAISETKPGATVILEARSIQQKDRAVPLLVEERYGRGRTVALLASDTWRWRMMVESKNRSFERFWINLTRYLVDSVRRPIEVAAERSFYGSRRPVRLRLEVADEKYININDAQATARVTSPTGRAVDVVMKPVIEEGFEGYAGTLAAEEDGMYKVEVVARRGGAGRGGSEIGKAETSFLVGPLNLEARNAAQNRELLKRIAADTGGRYYTPDQLDNLLDDITHTEGAGSIRVTYELWDMPINFLVIVGLAGAEWFIRKRKGLA